MYAAAMNTLLATCRAGFESECAQELTQHFAEQGVHGFARLQRDSGYLVFESADGSALPRIDAAGLIFPRQCLPVSAHFTGLDPKDRITPLLEWLTRHVSGVADVWTEAPDSPDGETLNAFCKSFESALVARLKREQWIAGGAAKRLQLFFPSGTECFLCLPDNTRPAPPRQGILRLRFPSEAPSRSTLKLEEAFLVLLGEDERERWLQPGMTAVDLGAAPGGWTYQLVRRSMRVSAVDNGPMAPALMESGLVQHFREDGFRFQPKKKVEWMVCDMVEQPIRVAERMATWLREGWCRRTVFNLKLPMKKRWQETERCLGALIEHSGRELDVRARQLYHDREEITVYAGPVARR
jgi:23S rRNA (cytidine2498-2'-O)-methyltransferase